MPFFIDLAPLAVFCVFLFAANLWNIKRRRILGLASYPEAHPDLALYVGKTTRQAFASVECWIAYTSIWPVLS